MIALASVLAFLVAVALIVFDHVGAKLDNPLLWIAIGAALHVLADHYPAAWPARRVQ